MGVVEMVEEGSDGRSRKAMVEEGGDGRKRKRSFDCYSLDKKNNNNNYIKKINNYN
jgi:hypothetical protein